MVPSFDVMAGASGGEPKTEGNPAPVSKLATEGVYVQLTRGWVKWLNSLFWLTVSVAWYLSHVKELNGFESWQ